jgi:hypothetical protein
MAGVQKIAGDSRANVAAALVAEAVAGTTAYAIFNFPFSILDKMALNIHRVEYWPEVTLLDGDGDYIALALIAGRSISNILDQTDPRVIDSIAVERWDAGTAANALYNVRPYTRDFTGLPGGGILVAPNPLAIAIKGNSLAGPASAWVRIHYTYMTLTTDEYWQLVESRRIISDD